MVYLSFEPLPFLLCLTYSSLFLTKVCALYFINLLAFTFYYALEPLAELDVPPVGVISMILFDFFICILFVKLPFGEIRLYLEDDSLTVFFECSFLRQRSFDGHISECLLPYGQSLSISSSLLLSENF